MKKGLVIACLLGAGLAPALGGPFPDDASGIPLTSGVFRAWVTGFSDYAHPPSSGGYFRDDDGLPSSFEGAVLGKPVAAGEGLDDSTLHVLSLGNGGSIVLEFGTTIYDGPGPDFAVFENGFIDRTARPGDTNDYYFAELAFVEVGSTTSAWARFPSTYLNTNFLYSFSGVLSGQYRYASQDITFIDGLAGRNSIGYGTPFDLTVLRTNPVVLAGDVDLSDIRYVRLVDIPGNGSARDQENRPIYDPYYHFINGYPAAAALSAYDGFDLRAIGVINELDVRMQAGAMSWYAANGQVFRLEGAASPVAGDWSAVGSVVTGADAVVSVPLPLSSGKTCFRVKRWTP